MGRAPIGLVTGASAGIGRACAARFLREGARVVVAGRRAERLIALQAEFGERVHPLVLDVRDASAVAAAISGLPEEFREIEVLVNSAGLALGTGAVLSSDPADWTVMIDTNIRGLLHVVRAVLPGMVERDRGHIFNLGSVAGSYPSGGVIYGCTNSFVNHFSLTLRRELLGRRVRVTSVEPGRVDTEFGLVRFKGDADRVQETERELRGLVAEEVAEAMICCWHLPASANVNRLEIMPVGQAAGPFGYAYMA